MVSPLISLMRDQVDSLRSRGIAAAFYNSSLRVIEQRAILASLQQGSDADIDGSAASPSSAPDAEPLTMLYVSPERFSDSAFMAALHSMRRPISLFVIDEAHCISTWGHDFRTEYQQLGRVVRNLGPRRVFACTATATKPVREDIMKVRCDVRRTVRPELFALNCSP